MATYLLDTSVIIDALNGKRNRHQFLKELLQQDHLLACCSINVTEVYYQLTLITDNLKHYPMKELRIYPLT